MVRFRATRNGPYRLETTGSLDTVCRLLDADANELATNDDSGDAMNCRIEHDLVAGQVTPSPSEAIVTPSRAPTRCESLFRNGTCCSRKAAPRSDLFSLRRL